MKRKLDAARIEEARRTTIKSDTKEAERREIQETITQVDVPQQPGEFAVLIVMWWHHDQAGAGLPGFPIRLPGLYARFLGQFTLGQHNAVPLFRTATDGHGLAAQFRVQKHLDGCVETVGVAMQDASVSHGHPSK